MAAEHTSSAAQRRRVWRGVPAVHATQVADRTCTCGKTTAAPCSCTDPWPVATASPASSAASPRREVLPLVVADLTERIAVGTETYGSPLAVESPNDALRFAYEEALDLALYLRQELARRV